MVNSPLARFALPLAVSILFSAPAWSKPGVHGKRGFGHCHKPGWPISDTLPVDLPGVLFADDVQSASIGREGRPFRPLLEPSSDTGGGGEIRWTFPDQGLDFLVESMDTAWFAPTLRVATLFRHRTLRLLLDGVDVSGLVEIPDRIGCSYRDVPLPAVRMASGRHALRVEFVNGGVKFRSLAMPLGIPDSPTSVRALGSWWPLRLAWSTDGSASEFEILRSWNGVDFQLAATTPDSFYTDSPPLDSARYRSPVKYLVLAKNGPLSSPPSETLTVDVMAAGGSLGQVGPVVGNWTPQGFLLHWNPHPGVKGYSIQIRNNFASSPSSVATSDTTYLDTSATPGRAYRVFGYNIYYTTPLVASYTIAF